MTWGQRHFQLIIPKKTIPLDLSPTMMNNQESSEILAVILNLTVFDWNPKLCKRKTTIFISDNKWTPTTSNAIIKK